MSKAVGVYPRIGRVDGDDAFILELPDVDSGSASTYPITIPTATNTNFRALSNMSGAGAFRVKLGATVYVIPLLTNA